MARGTLEWTHVPAGRFVMGADPGAAYAPDADEAPAHDVELEAFALARTPVTNAQYETFVRATGRRAPGSWPGGTIPPGREQHPVCYVSWDDASAYCRWAGGVLPTEAQWERAASGDDVRTWPWGETPPTPAHAVLGVEDTDPVGGREEGGGPYGHLDLAGNVWEWTSTRYSAYPYAADDGREAEGTGERVVRGGSFIHGPADARCSARHGLHDGAVDHYVGFRLAAPPGARTPGVDLLDVPAGVVTLGGDPRPAGEPARADEAPRATVTVAAFEVTTTTVTNDDYALYVQATAAPAPPHWPGGEVPAGLGAHPVTYVDWHDAVAFASWAGARLPTEAEWEKAARGSDGRRYPWGDDDPSLDRANAAVDTWHGSTAPVGASPAGRSPYGLDDMAGNVWEWVASAYRPYPYDADDGREAPDCPERRVLRGGSFASPTAAHLRCARRSASWPTRRSPHIGFRLARST